MYFLTKLGFIFLKIIVKSIKVIIIKNKVNKVIFICANWFGIHGEPKELEFGSEKSIHTKVLILTARVSADINLENLDTKNFDIVDLRE